MEDMAYGAARVISFVSTNELSCQRIDNVSFLRPFLTMFAISVPCPFASVGVRMNPFVRSK